MRYSDATIQFDVPDHWQDKTIIGFSAPRTSSKLPTDAIVVTREKPEPGDTLATYANRQLVAHARTLSGFTLLGNRPTTLGGQPAFELAFTWVVEGNGTILHQRQFIIERGQTMLSVMVAALEADYAASEAQLEAILRTVSFP